MARSQEVRREKDDDKILKDIILDAIHKYQCKTIGDLVDTLHKSYGITRSGLEIRNILEELQEHHEINLLEPKIEGPFFASFKKNVSITSFRLVAMTVAVTLATVYLSPQVEPWLILRMIVGGAFILFLPGYTFIELLLPRKEIDFIERIALSIGLSLLITPVVGLLLIYSPWGMKLDSIVISISAITLTLAALANYRRFIQLKPETDLKNE